MATKGNQPGRAARGARSRLDDSEQLLERKERQRTTGLVEIPGPLSAELEDEIRNIVRRTAERELQRDADARVSDISAFEGGLAVETNSEKLAQHIADALERSRKARVQRVFDDEGKRRILTCHLPGVGES